MKIELNLDYDKLKISLRYWLIGKEYWTALKAFEFGLSKHTGVRKDGVTPEFAHQIFQMQYARTLTSSMMYPERVLTTIALHDTIEDIPEVTRELVRDQFDVQTEIDVEFMTNCWENGEKKPKQVYYGEAATSPVASIGKGIDRLHNQQSMQGVFDSAKQLDYTAETRDYILPMMVEARKRFPQQEPVYHNIKIMLLTQMEFVAHLHGNSEDA